MSDTKPRIGPGMIAAVRYVAFNPGCRQYEAARAIGPHGSNNYGTRALRRAERAELIRYEGDSRGYRLYVTDRGRQAAGLD